MIRRRVLAARQTTCKTRPFHRSALRTVDIVWVKASPLCMHSTDASSFVTNIPDNYSRNREIRDVPIS